MHDFWDALRRIEIKRRTRRPNIAFKREVLNRFIVEGGSQMTEYLACSRLRDSRVRKIEKARTRNKSIKRERNNWGEKERARGPLFVSTISFAEFSVSTQCLFLLATSFTDPTFCGIFVWGPLQFWCQFPFSQFTRSYFRVPFTYAQSQLSESPETGFLVVSFLVLI